MHPTVVADAGGLLAVAGLVEGSLPDVEDVIALDATSLLVAEYLALRHEGAPARAHVEFALATGLVAEWFPIRALAVEAALSAPAPGDDIDAAASLALARSLDVPLVTKNPDIGSGQIPVLHC